MDIEEEVKVEPACFRTDVVVRSVDGDVLDVERIVTNAADYLPPCWKDIIAGSDRREALNQRVAKLHELRVRIAKSDLLVRDVFEGILSGEDRVGPEIARLNRAFTQAKTLADEIALRLQEVADSGRTPGRPSLDFPKGLTEDSEGEVTDVYLKMDAPQPRPGTPGELRKPAAVETICKTSMAN